MKKIRYAPIAVEILVSNMGTMKIDKLIETAVANESIPDTVECRAEMERILCRPSIDFSVDKNGVVAIRGAIVEAHIDNAKYDSNKKGEEFHEEELFNGETVTFDANGKAYRKQRMPHYAKHKDTLYTQQKGKCNGCRQKFDVRLMDVDHIRPKSRKGTSHINNLQLLCSPCNRDKGTMTMEEWEAVMDRPNGVMVYVRNHWKGFTKLAAVALIACIATDYFVDKRVSARTRIPGGYQVARVLSNVN